MRCKTGQRCGSRKVRSQVQESEVQRWRHALTFSAVDMDWGSSLHLHRGCKSWQAFRFWQIGTKRERSKICCIRGCIESGGSWECGCLLKAHEREVHPLRHAVTGKGRSLLRNKLHTGAGESGHLQAMLLTCDQGHENDLVASGSVEKWIAAARKVGGRSILCLLDERHLGLYASVPGGLLNGYRTAGLEVGHVPVKDHDTAPVTAVEMGRVVEEYEKLPKPVLIHCSAGVDPAGAAVKHLKGILCIGGDRPSRIITSS